MKAILKATSLSGIEEEKGTYHGLTMCTLGRHSRIGTGFGNIKARESMEYISICDVCSF